MNVCITTTTHIYNMPDRLNRPGMGDVVYRGIPEGEKLAYPGRAELVRLCREFDAVFVEADGSRHHPIKIPGAHEPVIPQEAGEIVVIMGFHSIGRPIGEVCQHLSLSDVDKMRAEFPGLTAVSPVTTAMIDFIAHTYYLAPLSTSEKFRNVPITYVRNNFLSAPSGMPAQVGKRVALILMTSGFSQRFGGPRSAKALCVPASNGNKLLYPFLGKELFRYGLASLIGAGDILLKENRIESMIFLTEGNGLEERLSSDERDNVKLVPNPERSEGIAGSIRWGTAAAQAMGCDAVLFMAGDQPNFPAADTARLVREFLCSDKPFGCAFSDHPANPGIFARVCYNDLMRLSGDAGAMRLIKKRPWMAYYYVVSPEKLLDVDRPDDLRHLILNGEVPPPNPLQPTF